MTPPSIPLNFHLQASEIIELNFVQSFARLTLMLVSPMRKENIMPKQKLKSQYTETDERIIYAIVNPITNEFIVNHVQINGLYDVYKHNHMELRYKTAESIRKLKKQGLKPCCFVLETVKSTKVEAYKHVIVWTKIFLENGYINLDTGNVIDYANDLFEKNQELYNINRERNLKEICSCNNCKFPNYGRAECPLKKE